MNRREHLLTILAEECAEVAQRVSKALRFGIDEVEPGQPSTNGARVTLEILDLLVVNEMLAETESLAPITENAVSRHANAKRGKIEKYLAYSKERGTLTE